MNSGVELTKRYLKLMFGQLRDANEQQVRDEIEHCRRDNVRPVRVPRKFRDYFAEDTYHGEGYDMQYFSTIPENTSRKLILYYHGGACIYQPVFFHWRFIHDISLRLHCRVVMPIYPKSPDYHCLFSNTQLLHFYRDYIQQQDVDEIILMGDSVGGAFALLHAQLIKENGYRKADNIVLLSPSLDLTYSREAEMKAYEPLDPMLKLDRVKILTDLWRDDLPAENYWVSPIFGDLNGLGRISIFVGTHEILYLDSVALKEKLASLGVPYDYFEYEGMFHTFPLFPIPEGFDALKRIVGIVL